MTTRFSMAGMVLTFAVYSGWITQQFYSQIENNVRNMQTQLALEKRVEELQRTRYGAVANGFVCKIRH